MRQKFFYILLSSLLAATLGCEEPKITPEQAEPFVSQWAEQIGPTVKEQASSAAASESLEAKLLAAREVDAKKLKPSEPPYGKLAEEVYKAREYKPAFVKSGKLTPNGDKILAMLETVDHDGFDARDYGAASVHENLEKLEKLQEEFAALGEFAPGDAERKFVREWVLAKKPDEIKLDASSNEAANKALLESGAGSSLTKQLEQYQQTSAKMAQLQADIESTLAQGLMRYARNMRYFRNKEIFVHPRHDDYYNNPETRGKRPTDALGAYAAGVRWRQAVFAAEAIAKKEGAGLFHKKLAEVLNEALDLKDKDIAPLLASFSPGPQYDALRKEYVRYREIVAKGGWEEISEKTKLRKGQRAPAVKQLKKRLKIEGYYTGQEKEFTDLFDDNLYDAVKEYQRTHQMDVDGKPGRSFWRSLNVSAERRLAQIELNMERWRNSNVNHHDHPVYVVVNIPDFHAEIWKDKKRAKRMRVVVGNNDREKNDETGEQEHPNRTPTVSAYIDRVIYNPFWNVTPRIREEETLVDVRKDLEGRYQAKVDKLIGAPAGAPKPATEGAAQGGGSPSPAGLQGGAGLGNLLGVQNTPPPKVYGKSADGWQLDIAAFKAAYLKKHGAEADVATLFPYVVPETGLVDVSKTDPNNIPPWYAANGYEVMHAGKSWEYVRQLNGDDNSLGRVKIIFPNLHDVYLHDTPHKGLFSREIRAYSHGCMRMHEPLDFAAWLLENDGQYDERTIKKYLADTTYMPIFLKHRVPVHVEYFTVRPDDKGRANFLIDIYDKDRIKKG